MYNASQPGGPSRSPYLPVSGFDTTGHPSFRANFNPDSVPSDTAYNASKPMAYPPGPRTPLPPYPRHFIPEWFQNSIYTYRDPTAAATTPSVQPNSFQNFSKPLQNIPPNPVGPFPSSSRHYWEPCGLFPSQSSEPQHVLPVQVNQPFLHRDRPPLAALPTIFPAAHQQIQDDHSLQSLFNYIKTHLANILLSYDENRYSAGERQERIHYSVLEAICYLVDRLFETVVIGSSETVSAHLLCSDSANDETCGDDVEKPRSSKVLPSDISQFLQTHFGFTLDEDK